MASILFFVRKLEGGGAERQLIALAKGLKARHHDVAIAVWRAHGPYEQEVIDSGIRYVVLEKRGMGDFYRFFRHAIATVRDLRPDVVHGYMDPGNFLAALVRPFARGSRIVWGIRNSGVDYTRYDWGGRLLFHVNRVLSRCADLIISNSHPGAEHIIRHGYPNDRVVVVANGIDTGCFLPRPESGGALRARWGFGPEHRVIGMAARLDPMKDHELFLEAAQMVAGRRPHVRFVCAGEGVEPYRSAILEKLRTSGLGDRLLWEGFVEDVSTFYSALDVATLTSRFGEGFSNAVGEAMACGVPCAATDVGDARLIVGDCGEIVPVGDPAALAAAWERLLDSAGVELSGACRARIADRFSVERLVTATEHAILSTDLR